MNPMLRQSLRISLKEKYYSHINLIIIISLTMHKEEL
jgi:hypothetical protein